MESLTDAQPGLRRASATTEEAAVAELLEELEAKGVELREARERETELRAERESLQTELVIARRWVSLLARELETTKAALTAEARPLSSRMRT